MRNLSVLRSNLKVAALGYLVFVCFAASISAEEGGKANSLDEIYNSLVKKGSGPEEKSEDGSLSRTAPKGYVRIPLSGMIELDFKTKAEVLALRKASVQKNFNFIREFYKPPRRKPSQPTLWQRIFGGKVKEPVQSSGEYQPSRAVFGQIEGKKPWWGILGISHFGPGEKGIAGPSEESRFLMNPYLFAGLAERGARIVGANIAPRAVYPRPQNLVFDFANMNGSVMYNISSYQALARQYRYKDAEAPRFTIIAYNARDFRLNFLAIDEEKTSGVQYRKNAVRPVALKQYIHRGRSCGYAGGCNNMSPEQPALNISVLKLPAELHLKFWKKKPKQGASTPADMRFHLGLR